MAQGPRIYRSALIVAAISGALAVGLGAFGAHGLRHSVTPERLEIWRTAVQYQMFHTLALLVLGLLGGALDVRWAARLFTVGILIFSGSLYVLVLSGIGVLGAVTPLGGAAFIAGWLSLGWSVWRGDGAARTA
jgi:uncharacterized membrane protein YgdD (TMEM256/DUF423 family)